MSEKVVLITGAAKRIGEALSLSMAKDGWDVVVHYNTSKKDADLLCKKINKLGRKAISVKADLSDEKQVRKIFLDANKTFKKITCLINNASVFYNDDIKKLSSESWKKHIDINLYAPIVLAQQFADQLGKNKGNIINMLDYCVLNLPDKFLSYAISKNGLWVATQMLARQLAPSVRVNGIGPGHTLPNDRETKETFDRARKKTPLQNGADVEEICNAVRFILSSHSMTGQILALDGGKHLIGADFY